LSVTISTDMRKFHPTILFSCECKWGCTKSVSANPPYPSYKLE